MDFKRILFSVLIIFSACQKKDFGIVNLNSNSITVLGHGGMGIGSTLPMNSFESISKCLSLGADGAEIDVQMTKDSVLVAYHDGFLEQSTSAVGEIFNKTSSEISNARYKDPPLTNYRVVTLDKLFSNIRNKKGYQFVFDCKLNPDTSALFVKTYRNAIIKVIDKHDLADNVFIEFNRRDIIKSIKNKRPGLKVFAYSDFDTSFKMALEFKLQGITIGVDNISKEQVRKAHKNGIMVAVFNTHSKRKNLEAIEKNVDFIQTDKLKYLIGVLK